MENKYFRYIEDALPKDIQDLFENEVEPNGNLPFYVKKSQAPEGPHIPWLSHYIVIDGSQNTSDLITHYSSDICHRVLSNTSITCNEIVQSRICMYLQSNLPNNTSGKHIDDVEGSNYTIIYYINDNDGGTVFYDDDGVELFRAPSKKGSAVVFDSSFMHAVLNPNKSSWRAVINYNITGTMNRT